MRDTSDLFHEVNASIIAVKAAKDELRLRTKELVAQMQEDGHDRAWGEAYLNRVCEEVDAFTARWARHFFAEEWPVGLTDE